MIRMVEKGLDSLKIELSREIMGSGGRNTCIYTGNTQLIHYIKEDRLGRINQPNDPSCRDN